MATAYQWPASSVGVMLEQFTTTPYPLNEQYGVKWAKQMIDGVSLRRTGPSDKSIALLVTTDSAFDWQEDPVDAPAGLIVVETATLVTIVTVNTGPSLYYIPIAAFWEWLTNPKKRPLTNLLRAVLSYLVRTIGIPHGGDVSSFLYDQMSGCLDLLQEETDDIKGKVEPTAEIVEESEAYREQVEELTHRTADLLREKKVMERCYQLLNDSFWADRLTLFFESFQPATPDENRLKEIIAPLLYLQSQYPGQTLSSQCIYNDSDNEVPPVSIDQYTGLIYSWQSEVVDSVAEFMDCCYQEGAFVEEPNKLIRFDAVPDSTFHDLTFSETMLKTMYDLGQWLTNRH